MTTSLILNNAKVKGTEYENTTKCSKSWINIDPLRKQGCSQFMNALDKAHAILLKKYREAKAKNPRWSQRAYAQYLGLSPGAISEILRGRRAMSLKLKKKISSKITLSPQEKFDFFSAPGSSESQQDPISYHTLEEDEFLLISDWWHYAILNLLQVRDFKPSPLWIANRLGLTPKVALQSWERLFRLRHLLFENGQVVRKYPRLQTSDGLLSVPVQKSHIQDTNLISHALQTVPPNERDNTSVTFVMKKQDMQKAKEMIRLFQDQFAQTFHTKSGDEVYKMSIALFPLSKSGKENE